MDQTLTRPAAVPGAEILGGLRLLRPVSLLWILVANIVFLLPLTVTGLSTLILLYLAFDFDDSLPLGIAGTVVFLLLIWPLAALWALVTQKAASALRETGGLPSYRPADSRSVGKMAIIMALLLTGLSFAFAARSDTSRLAAAMVTLLNPAALAGLSFVPWVTFDEPGIEVSASWRATRIIGWWRPFAIWLLVLVPLSTVVIMLWGPPYPTRVAWGSWPILPMVVSATLAYFVWFAAMANLYVRARYRPEFASYRFGSPDAARMD